MIHLQFVSVIHKTRSGQITFNDTFQQMATHEIPFGGCGESGCMCRSTLFSSSSLTSFFTTDGAYFGKFSFDTFTHLRGSIDVPLPYVHTDFLDRLTDILCSVPNRS